MQGWSVSYTQEWDGWGTGDLKDSMSSKHQ